jgi:hypothetical protein
MCSVDAQAELRAATDDLVTPSTKPRPIEFAIAAEGGRRAASGVTSSRPRIPKFG